MTTTKFSIIVPAYNEEQDIGETLKKLEELDFPDYEVIVVDDGSKDRTVSVVKSFAGRLPWFHLFLQPENKGVSSARNRGIRESKGEILVFLNADVFLHPGFLRQISPFYEQGNQWVAALNRICNQDKLYSRYMAACEHHAFFIQKYHWVWTEGFSCTKEAALKAGLFPEEMPGCYGEDVFFGLNLERLFKGVKTMDIVVAHVAPDELRSFWRQQKSRGRGRTNHYYYVRKFSFLKLFFNTLFASVWRIAKLIFLVPVARAWRLAACSSLKRRDFLPFIWVNYLQEIAMLLGMWGAFFPLVSLKRGCEKAKRHS